MKKRIGLFGLVAGTLVLGWLVSPLGAATKSVAYLQVAQAWTALQTFGAGLTVSSGDATLTTGNVTLTAGNVNVAGGSKVNLEASAGDTYLKRDADTGCIQEWKDGALGWQHCTNYAVPPDCATDTSIIPFGGMCKDQATGDVLMRTGGGLVALTGSAR